jgi:hypothetical protein
VYRLAVLPVERSAIVLPVKDRPRQDRFSRVLPQQDLPFGVVKILFALKIFTRMGAGEKPPPYRPANVFPLFPHSTRQANGISNIFVISTNRIVSFASHQKETRYK